MRRKAVVFSRWPGFPRPFFCGGRKHSRILLPKEKCSDDSHSCSGQSEVRHHYSLPTRSIVEVSHHHPTLTHHRIFRQLSTMAIATCLPGTKRRRFSLLRFFLHRRKEPFSQLVWKRAFDRILFRFEYESYESNKKWLDGDPVANSPLHFVMKHRPPLAVVEYILQYTSSSCHVPEEVLDSEGRTPLHVACASNCRFEVIERLLAGVSLVVPAMTKDALGRLPLHWAVCKPCLPNEHEVSNKYDTILLLLNANPQAINMADSAGKNAVDYAMEFNADKSIKALLKKASAKHKRQQEKALPDIRKFLRKDEHGESTERTSMSSVGYEIPMEVVPKTRQPEGGLGYLTQRLLGRPQNMDHDDISMSSIGNPSSIGGSVAHSLGTPKRSSAAQRRELAPALLPQPEEEDPEQPIRARSIVKGSLERLPSFNRPARRSKKAIDL